MKTEKYQEILHILLTAVVGLLVATLFALAVALPFYVNTFPPEVKPDRWIGIIPEEIMPPLLEVALCRDQRVYGPCRYYEDRVWQLSSQKEISSRVSAGYILDSKARPEFASGSLIQEGSECSQTITSWTLGAIHGATAVDNGKMTIVGQGQLTYTSEPTHLDSFPLPAGTKWVSFTFKRLDTSPCSVSIKWQSARLKLQW